MDTAAKTINVTSQIILHSAWRCNDPWRTIYPFCNSLPRWEGWIDVVLATLGWPPATYDYHDRQPNPKDAGWVHKALDCIAAAGNGSNWDDRTTNGVAGLLATLLYYWAPVDKKHIHILLRALTFHGHPSENAAALLVRDDQFPWFQDEQLQPILHRASAWSSLMHIALNINTFKFTESCVHMGSRLVQMTYWKSHVLAELSAWITISFRSWGPSWIDHSILPYNSILEEACQTEYNFRYDSDRALGLSYQVLCDVWHKFKFPTPEHMQISLPWLWCTSLVVRQTYRCGIYTPATPSDFKTAFYTPPRDVLLQAATAVKAALTESRPPNCPDISQERNEVLERFAKLLEDIAGQTRTEIDPEEGHSLADTWQTINTRAEQIKKEIDELDVALKTIIPTAADTVTASW
ncbi:hypothetical protein DFH06DRAFT_1178695 [Mycena polygramma]|nr:hypothetical protein DFH06DRAFT_1178695 [Mycena polygramma]